MIYDDPQEEKRYQMLQEHKEEMAHNENMHQDFEYFIEHTDAPIAIELLQSIKRVTEDYGYEWSDVLEEILANI